MSSNDILNKAVVHVSYGDGIVTDFDEKHIIVNFDKLESEKKFIYPDCCVKFIKFTDENLQNAAISEADILIKQAEKEKEKKINQFKIEEEERKKKHLETLKAKRKAKKTI